MLEDPPFRTLCAEPCLWCFKKPVGALRATLAASHAVGKAGDAFQVTGFGMHHGNMLFIEGTDVHWGDPVNTSSKLGQDLARGGELLVSKTVVEELYKQAPTWMHGGTLVLDRRDVTVSNVSMEAFAVRQVRLGSAVSPSRLLCCGRTTQ